MTDYLGKELGIGDEVVYMSTGRNPYFVKGVITGFKGQWVEINGHKKSTHKIIKVKH